MSLPAAVQTREEITERIIRILCAEIGTDRAEITLETPRDDLPIDSIDIVQVVFNIEEAFGVNIDLDLNDKFETVGDFVDAVSKFIPARDA